MGVVLRVIWAVSFQEETYCFFFSSRRRHTRLQGDWSSDVCSSDLHGVARPFDLGERGQEGGRDDGGRVLIEERPVDRKSTRLNSSHLVISYAVFCLKKKKKKKKLDRR